MAQVQGSGIVGTIVNSTSRLARPLNSLPAFEEKTTVKSPLEANVNVQVCQRPPAVLPRSVVKNHGLYFRPLPALSTE